ncbi:hypothetical protein [Micromonospora zamorensis]|uniref:hypothetical protein n=1 Tax=Micromonospora zamorensis TaxID=709883 RepID=UPI003CED1136
MTRRRPDRPSLASQRESIASPAAAAEPAEPPAEPTMTLSVRVPTSVHEHVSRELRRLHFETGRQKGEIAAAMFEEALSRIDAVKARLS